MTSTASRREIFLQEMGIGPVWHQRIAAENLSADVTALTVTPSMRHAAGSTSDTLDATLSATLPAEVANMDWVELNAAVAGCSHCGLCHSRTQTVFGTGDAKAKWLFVGEGPGRNEDLQGLPFVGPAGKLLDNMLLAMGLQRGVNVYIANIVKCRATDTDGSDRPPTSEERAACMPYLERQIALIQPHVIVALGKTAALSLLGVDQNTSVAQLRGTVHQFANLPLIVTYHPAHLLRNSEDKGKAWRDLSLAMSTYANLTRPAA